MPKIVDHEQRRAELADAVRRVVAREGVAGATVRGVAEESGWSTGALRHYFASQDDLLFFAFAATLASAEERTRRAFQRSAPGRRRAQDLVEQLLPLDDERGLEVAVYLAFLAHGRTDPRAEQVAAQAFAGEQYVCALAVTDLRGGALQVSGSGVAARVAIPRALQADVEDLQATVDGLCLLGTGMPTRMTPARMRRVLRRALDRIAGHGPA